MCRCLAGPWCARIQQQILSACHVCMCMSTVWALHAQVFDRTIACQILSACHACMCVSVTWATHVQVFGRTMVCKDVDVANKVAHRDNLDGVTMEGTQVSKKGVFKGGFHDLSRCVLCILSCPNTHLRKTGWRVLLLRASSCHGLLVQEPLIDLLISGVPTCCLSCTHLLIHSLIHLFIRSFTHSLIRSFIHSFIQHVSLLRVCKYSPE